VIHVALLRGINLGSRRRIAMADLRAWLADLGYTDVRTLLQSGNVVFRSGKRAATVRKEMEAALAERAGFAVDCVFRTGPELAAVVDADPFGDLATDPARYLVSFLDVPGTWPEIDHDAFAPERVHLAEREAYFWVPEGIQRSPILAAFPARDGEIATVRNWRTVTKLLAMTEE
jgi:uncharacterized protein (DUF1697 family)